MSPGGEFREGPRLVGKRRKASHLVGVRPCLKTEHLLPSRGENTATGARSSRDGRGVTAGNRACGAPSRAGPAASLDGSPPSREASPRALPGDDRSGLRRQSPAASLCPGPVACWNASAALEWL